jgi:hypothetical protein
MTAGLLREAGRRGYVSKAEVSTHCMLKKYLAV